jgi:ferredoxin-NADP reductase
MPAGLRTAGPGLRVRLTTADLPASIGAETTVLVCGSSGFSDAATEILLKAGVGNERIRVERFGPTR